MRIANKLAKIVIAGTATLVLAGGAVSAQENQTGQVTKVNRLDNTVAIRPVQSGTVGANTAGEEKEFKVKDGVSLEDLHAGNLITYSVMETGGTRTLTSFKKQ